jgi:hypothetical protein
MTDVLRRFWMIVAALLLSCGYAAAQAPVQQSGTMLNAGTQLCAITSSGTALAVNTQTTATCTAPVGQYVYLTGITFEVCTDGTATAQNQVTFTSTNISNTPSFEYSIAATASICQRWNEAFASPLKSLAPGTNVTFVSPSAALHNSYNIRAYYYNAP